jgi:hypothetical protein
MPILRTGGPSLIGIAARACGGQFRAGCDRAKRGVATLPVARRRVRQQWRNGSYIFGGWTQFAIPRPFERRSQAPRHGPV